VDTSSGIGPVLELGDGRSISLGDISGWALRPAGGKSRTGIGIGIGIGIDDGGDDGDGDGDGDGGGDGTSNVVPLPFQYEVALKGSGKTPYSRAGDGRAVLQSACRELLGDASLVALGVHRASCSVQCAVWCIHNA
jgi:hypothetical protein